MINLLRLVERLKKNYKVKYRQKIKRYWLFNNKLRNKKMNLKNKYWA